MTQNQKKNKISEADLIYFEEWLNNGKRNENTISTYMSIANNFAMNCKDYTDLEEYNTYVVDHCIKKKSRYARHVLLLLIKFLDMDNNIKRELKKKLVPIRISYEPITRRLLSENEKKLVISRLKDTKHRIIATIQDALGVRVSSVLRLRRDSHCISYEEVNGSLAMRIDFIAKNEKTFPMWIFDEKISNMIDMYINSNLVDPQYYFLLRNTPRNKQNIKLAIKANYKRYERDLEQALIQCGYKKGDFKTHDFRRMFAKKVWDLTKDVISVKESLHHARFDTTTIYLRQGGYQTKDVLHKMHHA